MISIVKKIAAMSLALLLIANVASANDVHKYFISNVLGTSMEITIVAPKDQADRAEHAIISEVKRLESVFSSYDASSEISLINAATEVSNSSPSGELVEMVSLCSKWSKRFKAAFSCRMGNVINLWNDYEQKQTRPDRPTIRKVARRAISSTYSVNDFKAGELNKDFSWNYGAIAKGYILDRALQKAKQIAIEAQAIGIDIGGDAQYWKNSDDSAPWNIALAIPGAADDGTNNTLGSLKFHSGAIAYSGHDSRSREIASRGYSHILMPRDGWPVEKKVSAVVRADSSVEADAIATALTLMDISEALDWVNKRPQYSALLIADEGRHYASKNWYQDNDFEESNNSNKEVALIKFALPRPKSGEYRKPYVAIWLENSEHKVIRNLLLLGDSERWMKNNKKWWRRQGVKETYLLDGFSRTTRRQGKYELSWDGKDDFGKSVANGKYFLVAEAAREFGGHEELTIAFEYGLANLREMKVGNTELEFISLELLQSKHNLNVVTNN